MVGSGPRVCYADLAGLPDELRQRVTLAHLQVVDYPLHLHYSYWSADHVLKVCRSSQPPPQIVSGLQWTIATPIDCCSQSMTLCIWAIPTGQTVS